MPLFFPGAGPTFVSFVKLESGYWKNRLYLRNYGTKSKVRVRIRLQPYRQASLSRRAFLRW